MCSHRHTQSDRRQSALPIQRCALCSEDAVPHYGGYCIRHVGVSVDIGVARSAIRRRG